LVIAGYRAAAEPEDRLVFVMADGPDTFGRWWNWKQFGEYVTRMIEWRSAHFGRHTQRVEPVPPRETALRVLRDLVAWSEVPPEHVRRTWPKATWGIAGMDLYAEHCADVETHESWGLCHPINPQIQIRNSTAVWLDRLADAGTLGPGSQQSLRDAARAYRAAYRQWAFLYDLLGHGAPEGAGKDPAVRAQGAAMARGAAEAEREAIAALRNVLAAGKSQ
jgi:hypothetical protein